MDLLEKFKLNVKINFTELNAAAGKLLIAVSGGVDSVVLADLLYKSGFDFAIAHGNFQLRGHESLRDEEFVVSLEKKYAKKVFVKKFDTKEFAFEQKLSVQEAARILRYQWFQEIVQDVNSETQNSNLEKVHSTFNIQHSKLSFVATAHNADDNVETLLINFFRGTGIAGLHGIPSIQHNIIRPLLFATRADILGYAKEHNVEWVEDSSNREEKYTRNYFRLNLIPPLEKIFPQVKENLIRNIEKFAEAEILYRQAVDEHIKKLVAQKGNEFYVPLLLLRKSVPLRTILWEIVKPFNFSSNQTDEIIKLLDAENSSYISSATHRIIKDRKHLVIAPLQVKEAAIVVIEEADNEIYFEAGKLVVRHQLSAISKDSNDAFLDASKIKFPLLLRKWKKGDYFYPLGMQKKKKLSRFLIDKKLNATQKENCWVIEMNKKIIWVVGQRIDDRFKVAEHTITALNIKFIPA